jgi:hypothetical protein
MFPTCFTLSSGIFHKFPIYLVFNSGWQKYFLSLFWIFYFRLFRSYGIPKRARSGSTVHKFWDASNKLKWFCKRSIGWKWRPTRWAGTLVTWSHPFWASAVCLLQSSYHRIRFDLKTTIYSPCDFILRRTEAEIKNTKTELQATAGGRLEGLGNRYQNRLRLPLLLHQHLRSALHHDRGVVHPWTWGLW